MSKIDVTNWQEKMPHEILDEKYISKDKIREKIEKLDKLIEETQKELGSASKEFTIYVYQKDILQDLLEEE